MTVLHASVRLPKEHRALLELWAPRGLRVPLVSPGLRGPKGSRAVEELRGPTEPRAQRGARAWWGSLGSQVCRVCRATRGPPEARGSQGSTAVTAPKETLASEGPQDKRGPPETRVFQDLKDFQENRRFTSLMSQDSRGSLERLVCLGSWGPPGPGAWWGHRGLKDSRGPVDFLVCPGFGDLQVRKAALCPGPKEKRGSRALRGLRGPSSTWSLQTIISLKETRVIRA